MLLSDLFFLSSFTCIALQTNNITKIYIKSIVYFKMFSIFVRSLTMNIKIKMNVSYEREKRTT
jgi:hypothetical protein